MIMQENKFAYGENDYVSIQTVADYLSAKYATSLTYQTMRKIIVQDESIEYVRVGRGRGNIRARWGSVLEYEEKHILRRQKRREE